MNIRTISQQKQSTSTAHNAIIPIIKITKRQVSDSTGVGCVHGLVVYNHGCVHMR